MANLRTSELKVNLENFAKDRLNDHRVKKEF